MDELQKIRAFLDVVENGSFSAAARMQDASVSSVARRVAALEDDLGVRLLNRTTRKLAVTEAGELYYQRAREAVRDLDSARVEASSFQQSIKGVLRVSLRLSVGEMVIPELKRFLDDYPGLTVGLSLTDERLDLLQNNIDVAVWVGSLDDSELVARLLSSGRRLLCASPDYLARHGVPTHPSELSDHQCLAFRAPNYDGTWRFHKDGDLWNIRANGPLQSSSGLALMSAALSGLGIVVLQKYMVQKELEAGTLKAILTDYEVSPTDADSAIYAVYPHSRHLAPKARAFIDFLIGCFREIEAKPLP
jgi:DNA-binding transcriptional LysR family regulator